MPSAPMLVFRGRNFMSCRVSISGPKLSKNPGRTMHVPAWRVKSETPITPPGTHHGQQHQHQKSGAWDKMLLLMMMMMMIKVHC